MSENTKSASEGEESGDISPTRVTQKVGSPFGGASEPSLKATPQRDSVRALALVGGVLRQINPELPALAGLTVGTGAG